MPLLKNKIQGIYNYLIYKSFLQVIIEKIAYTN